MSFLLSRRCATQSLVWALACAAAGPALAATPAPAPATTTTVQHARGTAQVPLRPQRVVMYDLAALDIAHSLALPVVGVPKAQFPAYLAAYADTRYTVAGSLFEPDYDALSRLQPDLIVVGGRSAAKFETLSKIAPTLDLSVRNAHLLDDMARNITTLAGLWGQQAQGEALMAQLRHEVTGLRSLAAQAGPSLLVLAVNERLNPQAPGSRFGLLHDVFGLPAAVTAAALPPRGTAFTMDDVARINPEWLLVIDRNAATGSAPGGGAMLAAQQVFDTPQVKASRAGQQGQVVFLDPKGWYLLGSAGPTALRGNVAQLRQALEQARR